MKEYLKSFVIGSSCLCFLIFFFGVYTYSKQKIINYSYTDYTFRAPIFLGLVAVIAKYIHLNYKLSLRYSLLITSILSSISVMIGITYWNAYKFKTNIRWLIQYITVLIGHTFVFTIIVHFLEKNIT